MVKILPAFAKQPKLAVPKSTHSPALVFDLDGTLIDSAPDIHLAANRVLQEEGLAELSLAQVRGFIGNGVQVLLRRCLTALECPTEGDRFDRMVARFGEIYETAHGQTTLYPGVATALQTLRGRYTLAICTNKPEAPTRSVLAHFGLLDLFPVIVGGDSLPVRKPDPAPLLAAIKHTGAATAFFVGDSEVDAETAQRAGVPLILFTEGYRKTPVTDLGARETFSDWGALPQILENLHA